MGILIVAKELDKSDIMPPVFSFLRNCCSGTVDRVFCTDKRVSVYSVEGNDIPKGNIEFGLRVEELVPNVLAITIE